MSNNGMNLERASSGAGHRQASVSGWASTDEQQQRTDISGEQVGASAGEQWWAGVDDRQAGVSTGKQWHRAGVSGQAAVTGDDEQQQCE
jgi:hypothetical protein